MRKMAIGLLLGSLSVLLFTDLLHYSLCLSILLITVFFLVYFKLPNKSLTTVVLAAVTGFCLTASVADYQRSHSFDTQYEGKDLLVKGSISSLVNRHKNSLSFDFKVDKAVYLEQNRVLDWQGLIKLSAYRNLPDVKAGEDWQFKVRLKRSSGFMNPGGFDYEKWLFAQGIDAKGYLKKSSAQQRITAAPWYSINAWRASIRDKVTRLVAKDEHSAILNALMIADKSTVTQQQWEVLRSTGTSHLMAISGLHIGLVAGFGLILAYSIWWCVPALSYHIPVKLAGSIAGVMLAVFYAMLAGFTIPTQRALLMVIVALLLMAGKRHYSPSRVLALALIAVIVIDPLAVMNVGFFLSFSAVAIILWILFRSVKQARFRLLKLQGFLSLLMIPLGFLFFGEGSLVSPLANLIAIPWVSLVVVPFSFLAVLLSYLNETLAAYLFSFLSLHLDGLFILLEVLAELPKATLAMHYLPMTLGGLLIVVACVFLLPSGMIWRYAAVLVLLPVLFYSTSKPEKGDFWFTVLDVGQGLSVVIQTQSKTLVYDTGDRPTETFDLGNMVVLPYLKHQSLTHIDALVLSHDDRDHSGGAQALFDGLAVKQLYGNRSDILLGRTAEVCQRGLSWKWEGVSFEFLHPSVTTRGNDNNHSCVLKVSNKRHSVLLTGDIQKPAERQLLKEQKEALDVDIIVMPHHGSNSSSTKRFIKAVDPEWAVASAGYRSRYRHPDYRVIKRYQKQGVQLLGTATDGAIQFKLSADSKLRLPSKYRASMRKFWSRELAD